MKTPKFPCPCCDGSGRCAGTDCDAVMSPEHFGDPDAPELPPGEIGICGACLGTGSMLCGQMNSDGVECAAPATEETDEGAVCAHHHKAYCGRCGSKTVDPRAAIPVCSICDEVVEESEWN